MPRPRYSSFDGTRQQVVFCAAAASGAYLGAVRLETKESGDSAFKAAPQQIGKFASAVAGSGVKITAARPIAWRVYGDDGAVALAAGEYRVAENRFLLTTVTPAATTLSVGMSHLKIVGGLTGGHLVPLGDCLFAHTAYVEADANYTDITATYSGCYRARLEAGSANTTVASGKYLSAFVADLNGAPGGSGVKSVLHVPAPLNSGNWGNLMTFATGSNYECGVKVGNAGAVTAIGGATHVASGTIKVLIGATPFYIPLYAASELAGE